ncbi:MAG: acyloxyacyl hydrolase [Pseudomonadota bacterium]
MKVIMFVTKKTWNGLASAASLALLLAAPSAMAADTLLSSASLEAGTGNKTQMIRFGLQSDWSARWFASNGTHLSGYWDATLAQWRANQYRDVAGATQNITDIGFTPVFRFENDSKKGFYAEGGIGFHRLSELYNNDGRRLSTLFEFGDHIGTGYVFDNGWEAGMKIQHFSNGGYRKPNSGVNWLEVKASLHF